MEPIGLTLLKAIRRAVPAGTADVLAPYLEKVRRHAYKITDEDVKTLLAAGLTQEQIYEATLHAAATTGIERFEIGLRALDEAKR